MQNVIINNAKIMPKAQLTLPKDIRDCRGGFHIRPDSISALSAINTMKMFQKEMEGETKKAGLYSSLFPNSVPSQVYFKAVTPSCSDFVAL